MAGKDADLEELCSDPKVKSAALKELNNTGKAAGFKSLEVRRLFAGCVAFDPLHLTPSAFAALARHCPDG